MNNKYKYIAFISYKREDEKWAKWLQHKLEHYKLPTSIRKTNPSLPERVRPVFKDTTDLAGGVLEKAIKEALQSSKYLIVICSPRAAQSHWVCKEVQEFIDSDREEYIIPFIIDGEPNSSDIRTECFPRNLKQLSGSRELLGININEMGRDAAAIKVAARMFRLFFDNLWQRHNREKQKKRIFWGGIAILLIFVLILLNYYFIKLNNEISVMNNEILKKNEEIIIKNENLEIKDLSQRISLLDVEINKGNNISSLLQLNYIQKNYIDIIKKGNLKELLYELEQQCIKNIKQYPIKLLDINIMENNKHTIENIESERLILRSTICDVVDNLDDSYLIRNKVQNKDTILTSICQPVITQDKRFLVYSSNEDDYGILYFYDIRNNAFHQKIKLTDLWLWYTSQGGVLDVSYDNRYVLFHHNSRGREETFIIDLLTQKLITDKIPHRFPRISADKKFLLDNVEGSMVIYDYKNNKEYGRINDSFFDNAELLENNLIQAIKDSVVTIWEIDNEQNIYSIDINTDVSGRLLLAECSPNGNYFAIITDSYLHIWDVKSGDMICKYRHNVYYPNSLTFSVDCKKIAYVGIHGYAGMYNIEKNTYKTALELAQESTMAGSNYHVDFIFNDTALITYEKDNLNFCHSLYSLSNDSIFFRECNIYAINNDMMIIGEPKYDNSNDTIWRYDNKIKSLSPISKSTINQYKKSTPYYKYNPTWIKFDEFGLLYVSEDFNVLNVKQKKDYTNSGICVYQYEDSLQEVNVAEKYICDSLYKIRVFDREVIISKQNIIDNIGHMIE